MKEARYLKFNMLFRICDASQIMGIFKFIIEHLPSLAYSLTDMTPSHKR